MKRYRFNSHARPYRYEQVERFLSNHGYPNVQLRKDSAFFRFEGGLCENWEERHVPVSRIRALTLGMWLEEFEYLMDLNKSKLESKKS